MLSETETQGCSLKGCKAHAVVVDEGFPICMNHSVMRLRLDLIRLRLRMRLLGELCSV